MPAQSPVLAERTQDVLRALGGMLRTRRKVLGLSAVITAESAGMSRVTLHRIEAGEPSVTIGAYLKAAQVLGLQFSLQGLHGDDDLASTSSPEASTVDTSATVRPDDFPQLRAITWQLSDDATLTEEEALQIYERNWRHVDQDVLTAREHEFIRRLVDRYSGGLILV